MKFIAKIGNLTIETENEEELKEWLKKNNVKTLWESIMVLLTPKPKDDH